MQAGWMPVVKADGIDRAAVSAVAPAAAGWKPAADTGHSLERKDQYNPADSEIHPQGLNAVFGTGPHVPRSRTGSQSCFLGVDRSSALVQTACAEVAAARLLPLHPCWRPCSKTLLLLF